MARAAAFILFLSFLCGSVSALAVGPRIYEQRDLGDIGLSEFTYSLSADCNASTISAYVMNESNRPIRDANIYLKYVDFSTPLLSNSKTDKDGYALIRLPGNVRLMRGLFIMVIEKSGYRNKEVHFDLSPCFGGSQVPPKPGGANATANATNQTGQQKPPSNATAPNQTAGQGGGWNNTAPSNATGGQGEQNETPAGGEGRQGESLPCQAALLLSSVGAGGLLIGKGRGGVRPRWRATSYYKSLKPR